MNNRIMWRNGEISLANAQAPADPAIYLVADLSLPGFSPILYPMPPLPRWKAIQVRELILFHFKLALTGRETVEAIEVFPGRCGLMKVSSQLSHHLRQALKGPSHSIPSVSALVFAMPQSTGRSATLFVHSCLFRRLC